jgi:hypothetical protein
MYTTAGVRSQRERSFVLFTGLILNAAQRWLEDDEVSMVKESIAVFACWFNADELCTQGKRKLFRV